MNRFVNLTRLRLRAGKAPATAATMGHKDTFSERKIFVKNMQERRADVQSIRCDDLKSSATKSITPAADLGVRRVAPRKVLWRRNPFATCVVHESELCSRAGFEARRTKRQS